MEQIGEAGVKPVPPLIERLHHTFYDVLDGSLCIGNSTRAVVDKVILIVLTEEVGVI